MSAVGDQGDTARTRAERSSDVRRVFEAARRRDPEERPAFLDDACGDDAELRGRVETLLLAWDDEAEVLRPATASDQEAAAGPGARVGHYIVRQELGRGGMGVVYLADDTLLSRRVALKAIRRELSDRADQRERLRQEARAVATLSHPGVATVFALEEFHGVIYVASEFVPGRTLRRILEDGPIDEAQAIDIGLQIARVLQAAHAQGLVHRDLKPENVILTPAGLVKVLDFGLALHEDPGRTRLTQSGAVVGTPAYMAPEQVQGDPIDFSADVFSLGVLLYELVSGVNPFEAATFAATADRLLRLDPPPLKTPAQQPSRLADVVTRCLAKRPDGRYRSTQALVRELEQLRSASTTSEVTPPRRHESSASSRARRSASARWWWEFHEIAISIAYATFTVLVWYVRAWIPPVWVLPLLFAVLACAAAATSLRLHLAFLARVSPGELHQDHGRVVPWVRASDVGFALTLIATAVLIGANHQAWATLLVIMAIVGVVASLAIEPATTRAAFRRRSDSDRVPKKSRPPAMPSP